MRKLIVAAMIAALSIVGSAAVAPTPAQAMTCESDPQAVCDVFLYGMSVTCKYTGKYAACFQ